MQMLSLTAPSLLKVLRRRVAENPSLLAAGKGGEQPKGSP